MTSGPAKRKKDELKYYGRNACLAIFKERRSDIVRVYVAEQETKGFGLLLKWCAKEKRAYHVVPEEELEKITAAKHHEGVCVLAKRRPQLGQAEIERKLQRKELSGPLVFLDGVANPHNVGSILRNCAHFGVELIIAVNLPALSAAACRTAEGAAEYVQTASVESARPLLEKLKRAGYSIFTTSSRDGKPIFGEQLPRQSVFILGSEEAGVSRAVAALADSALSIPGTGAIESLNVSGACAALLAEHYRRSWKK